MFDLNNDEALTFEEFMFATSAQNFDDVHDKLGWLFDNVYDRVSLLFKLKMNLHKNRSHFAKNDNISSILAKYVIG